MLDLRLALRLARRELRGGLGGFRIFFLCLMLGSAAIAGVESLSAAFLTGLQDQGQVLLGGDVSVNLVHRPASSEEMDFLNAQGRVTTALSMRAMAYAKENNSRQLVELKGVDARWPARMTASAARQPNRPCSTDCMCGGAT